MENLILIIKGIIIGTGKIIPGVSGGMLAITLNVYDKGINAISNFFKDIKNNFFFLLKLGIGIIIAILMISKVINYSLNNYYLPTMFLFIGLIIGGLPSIFHEVKNNYHFKNIGILLLPIMVTLFLSIMSNSSIMIDVKSPKVIFLFLMGIIDAVTMIIPGISGTAILMMLGYYSIIMNAFSTFTNINLLTYNLSILIPFILGLIIGVITLSKMINYLLNKYKISCYFAIIGFSIASILMLFKLTMLSSYHIKDIVISIILLCLGYIISSKLEKLS